MMEEHIATTIIDVTAEQISLLMAITGRPKILLEPASFWLIGIHFYIHWLSHMAIISHTGCFLWWSTLPVMCSTGNPQIFIGRVVLQVSYHVWWWWMLMTNRYAAVTSCPQNHGLPVPPAHSPTFSICHLLRTRCISGDCYLGRSSNISRLATDTTTLHVNVMTHSVYSLSLFPT